MSDPKVEEIRARLAAAMPGPWCHYPEAGTIEIAEGGDEVHSGAILVSSVRPRLGWGADIYTGDEPDAEFIAHSPTDINYLLTRLDEAEKRERILIAALRQVLSLTGDIGPEARRILSRLLPSTPTEEGKSHE